MFFFSSRRRHTRSKRDWSSDVCSSDLKGLNAISGDSGYETRTVLPEIAAGYDWCYDRMTPEQRTTIRTALETWRSEERRVGKERRSRRRTDHWNTTTTDHGLVNDRIAL